MNDYVILIPPEWGTERSNRLREYMRQDYDENNY